MGTDDWRVVLGRAEAAVAALSESASPTGVESAPGDEASEALRELRRVLNRANGAGDAAGAFDLDRMQVLGHLASGVAHEINNWFFVIRGFSELARLDIDADDPVTENFDQIEGAVDCAQGLTKMVLECAHPSGDGFSSTQLHPLVKEGLKTVRGSLPDGILVQQAISTEAMPVLLEPIRFYRVVMTLLTLAADRLALSPGLLWVALKDTEPDETGENAAVVLTVGSATGDDSEELRRRLEFDGMVVAGPPSGGDTGSFAAIEEIIRSFGGELRHRSTDGGGLSVEVVLLADSGPALR